MSRSSQTSLRRQSATWARSDASRLVRCRSTVSPEIETSSIWTPGGNWRLMPPQSEASTRSRVSSWQTRRFDADDTGAGSFLQKLAQDRDVLVQPFIQDGELAMVWIDGQLTHAVEKAPRFHGADERVTPRPNLDVRHRDFAQNVMAAARQDVLYARIDVIELKDGSLMLSELEMIEPSLYFHYCDDASRRFVEAVEQLVS